MTTPTRPDVFDEINAFRAGYRHGVDRGIVTPREAEAEMRRLFTFPITSGVVDLFCNGAEHGARGDAFRFLSYLAR
jgi:hypothetical protein